MGLAGPWTQGATKTNAQLTKNPWNSITVVAPAGQTIQRIGVGFDWVTTYSGTFYIDSATYSILQGRRPVPPRRRAPTPAVGAAFL